MKEDPAVGPRKTSIPVFELMTWIAGLAALTGLMELVIRRTMTDPEAGLIGGMLVLYVVHISVSVRAFWDAPRIIIPTTLLIGGSLWTMGFQFIERSHLSLAFAMVVSGPFVIALLLRRILSKMFAPDEDPESTVCLSTIHLLLLKNRGFGRRSVPVPEPTAPEH